MKILFVINTMQGGGAARVTSILANQLSRKGCAVSIATNLSKQCTYYVSPEIGLYNIYGHRHKFSSIFSRFLDHVFKLRKVLACFQPDIVIGEQEDGMAMAKCALLFSNTPIIGHRHNSFKILGLSKLQRLLFNSVNYSVFLHKTDVSFVGNRIKNKTSIYNPCSYSIVNVNQHEKKKILAVVGSIRRYKDKGFDLVLDIWGTIAKKYPDWTLCIIGGGSDDNKDFLMKKTSKLGISNQVVFTGIVDDVDKRLQAASIFLLPSRVEGFPMVLNEAISQGCACVCFSLKGVTKELYSKGAVLQVDDGDTENFCKMVEKLILDIELREKLSKQAQIELQKYLPDKIVNDWVSLIEKVMNLKS